jgi:predicted  nucleic acid-binding Zn-ribbon protein
MDEDSYSDMWNAFSKLEKKISNLEYRLEKMQDENMHIQDQIDKLRCSK